MSFFNIIKSFFNKKKDTSSILDSDIIIDVLIKNIRKLSKNIYGFCRYYNNNPEKSGLLFTFKYKTIINNEKRKYKNKKIIESNDITNDIITNEIFIKEITDLSHKANLQKYIVMYYTTSDYIQIVLKQLTLK